MLVIDELFEKFSQCCMSRGGVGKYHCGKRPRCKGKYGWLSCIKSRCPRIAKAKLWSENSTPNKSKVTICPLLKTCEFYMKSSFFELTDFGNRDGGTGKQ